MDPAPSHCPLCFGTSWSLTNGVLVCDSCGTQSQVYVEEAQEFQTGIDDSRYRQRAQRSKAPVVKLEARSTDETPKADSIQKMMLWYCRCLQHALQDVVTVLQTECGLGASLSSVVRRLWLANIAESGILTQNFSRIVEQSFEAPALQEHETVESSRKPVWRTALKAAVWKALNPDAVLAVSFLGCWYLREAVTPMDILRWASDGRLPVLSLPPLSAKLLQSAQEADCTLPPALLHPTGVMGVQELVAMAGQIGSRLKLRLPPVNAGALIHRYVQDLALPEVGACSHYPHPTIPSAHNPSGHRVHVSHKKKVACRKDSNVWVQEMAPVALRLFDIYQSGSPQVWLQDDVFLHPYAHLMAILLVTLKLCCQLDIPGEATGQSPDWQAWARAVVQQSPGPHAYPATALQAAAMSDKGFSTYMDYLRSNVFRDTSIPEGLADIVKAIKQRAGLERKPDSAGREPVSDHSGDSTRQIPTIELGSSTGKMYRMACVSEASAEHRLGADYVSLLTACAAYLWLQPSFLHRLVCQLEENMGQLETEQKHMLHNLS